MTHVKVPATTKGPAADVLVGADGSVTWDDRLIGYVFKGSYSVSPKAAGHGGRIVRYHAENDEWAAVLPNSAEHHMASKGFTEGADFRGGDWKQSRRKNSRKAACAFLVAVASGVTKLDAEYFYWERTSN